MKRWPGDRRRPYTREDTVRFVTQIAPQGRADGREAAFAVEADGGLVGMCGVHELGRGRCGGAAR